MPSFNHNGHRPLATTNGHPASPHVRPPGESLIAAWPIMRIWCLALAISTAIAAADAVLGHHVILIGLLIIGPCCALLTGRWIHTAIVGAWAIATVTTASASLIERVQVIRRERIRITSSPFS